MAVVVGAVVTVMPASPPLAEEQQQEPAAADVKLTHEPAAKGEMAVAAVGEEDADEGDACCCGCCRTAARLEGGAAFLMMEGTRGDPAVKDEALRPEAAAAVKEGGRWRAAFIIRLFFF